MLDYLWWNDAQRKLQQNAMRFTEEVLMPIAEKSAYKKEWPWDAINEIKKLGWFGATIPKKYGGRREDWGITGAAILIEESSRAGMAAASLVSSLIGATAQIVHDGTEEQKQRWLPGLAKGELFGCITMTEPYAGSDIASIEATAVREGDFYRVNGKKRSQTCIGAADIYMTYLKTGTTDNDRKNYRHLTGMILEKGMPGFSIERVNSLIGMPGIYNGYLNFDNVMVPAANVIGGEGNGWKVMMSGLNIERALASASYLGGMRESICYAKQHLERRVQFGQTTGSFQVNQFKLADMYSQYLLSRLLIYFCTNMADQGKEVPIEAALAKLFGSESSFNVSAEAMQCMGGNGVNQNYPVERFFRDSRHNYIAAGTNEVLRLLVYRMGNQFLGPYLKPPVRMMDAELNVPLPVGKVTPQPAKDEMDVLNLLAEDYRVNPGLHMNPEDILRQLDISAETLAKYLDKLEEKGFAVQLKNKKGVTELVRATNEGLKAVHPAEYYKQIPDWVNPKDMF